MKTIDEVGTIVYFNIPDDAVVTVGKDEIIINLINNEMSIGTVVGNLSGVKSFMRFAKASSTLRRSPSYFYLQDEEFALLQKKIEQHFAKPMLAPTSTPPRSSNVKGGRTNV